MHASYFVYAKGIRDLGNIIKKTKIIPDIINVGGGFPSIYPDLQPQPLENYISEIKKGIDNLKLENKPELLCEPGRALVAESGSSIVRVVLRKKQKLYINDGPMVVYLMQAFLTLFFLQE